MKTKVEEMTVILEELRQIIEPVETGRNQLKLDDMLTRLRKEPVSCIGNKGGETYAVNEKDVSAKEEVEDLNRALSVASEEAEKEILLFKSEISRIQDETAETLSKADSDSEELKSELAKVKALADERESELNKTAEGLRMELYNMKLEMGEKNQLIRALEVLNTKQRAERIQGETLDGLLQMLGKDTEEAVIEKLSFMVLQEQLQDFLDGHVIKVGNAEVENIRIDALAFMEQHEARVMDRDDEIERLKAEIENLTAECFECRAMLEDNAKIGDFEIANLELEIIRIKAEFEDRSKNSSCQFENARSEHLVTAIKESQNLVKTKDEQIDHLEKELLKLKDIERQLENTEGELEDVESQLEEKISTIIRLKAEFRENNVNLGLCFSDNMKAVKDRFALSKKESDDLILSKDSEIQRLLAERRESSKMRSASDKKIRKLETRLEAFRNDAHKTENLNLELQELRAECERLKLIIEKQESEIEQLTTTMSQISEIYQCHATDA